MGVYLWPFLIYWLTMFVACYAIVEFGQDFFYDEVTPYSGLKVAIGSLIMAGLLAWLRPSFDTMFTQDLPWTVLQAIVWFGIFSLIFQFHPLHALSISLVALCLIPGVASMGVESLTRPAQKQAPIRQQIERKQPVRRSLGGSGTQPVPNPAEAPAKK